MAGSHDSAQKAAARQQKQQQEAIARTQAQINQVFDNPQRQADIDDFVQATKAYYDQDLDRQKADADRNLTFALAKSGLTGGSVNVDQQRLLGQNYARGQLEAEQKAMGAGASLQQSDQDARARLISLATQGLDTTTAATQAAEAMRTNLQAGQAGLQASAMGDAFSSLKPFMSTVDAGQQRRNAIHDMATNGLYGTLGFGGRNTGYGG